MNDVVQLTGNVNYELTIDPTVWIFDDRKIKLEECFHLQNDEQDKRIAFSKAMARQWDKERSEETNNPPVRQKGKRQTKEDILQGSYVMPFLPFIENAQPKNNVISVTVVQKDESTMKIDLKQARDAFLCFSSEGRPLKDDGPIHLYFGDESNRDTPIKNIRQFIFN